MGTIDKDHQRTLTRQMDRHTHDQAYFLFPYNPVMLYATNKAVSYEPSATTVLPFKGVSVTDRHWSIRAGRR